VAPLEIEQVRANWDVLYEGLSSGKKGGVYDVVISSKKPYNFNEAFYHFSPVFLDTGLVAIFLQDAKEQSWKEMEGKRIGALGQYTFLQEKAGLLIHFYEGIPTMCDDLVERKIDACLLPNIAAIYFLKNLYVNQMKIASFVTKEGLRFISLKDKKDQKIEKIEKALSLLEKNQTIEKLKSKWGLTDLPLWDPNWKDSFEMK
jgi:ABC-type amino acid transport substrate-binding protein